MLHSTDLCKDRESSLLSHCEHLSGDFNADSVPLCTGSVVESYPFMVFKILAAYICAYLWDSCLRLVVLVETCMFISKKIFM